MTITNPATTTTTADAPPARLLRTAAIGAIVAGVAYLLLPLFRGVVEAIIGASDSGGYPHPADVPSEEWWGVSGAVIFAGIGIGMLLLTGAVTRIAAGRGETGWSRLGGALGTIGGAAYLFAGAVARVMYSFIAANLTQTGADAGAQTAALWAVNIVSSGVIVLAGCAMAGWFAWLATGGRHLGLVATPVSVLLLIAAALLVVAELGAVFLPVQFVFIPVLVMLAIVFALGARRAAPVAESPHRG